MSRKDSSDIDIDDWMIVSQREFCSNSEDSENEPEPSADVRELTSNVDRVQDITEHKNQVDDVDGKKSEGRGSDGSDYERIQEDELEESFHSDLMSSYHNLKSCIVNPPTAPVEIEKKTKDRILDDSLDADDEQCDSFCNSKDVDQLPAIMNCSSLRTYTHTPNRKVNVFLTTVLILTLTLVCGLGIGHFLGWSNQWSKQYRLHQMHVVKLKALQEELSSCLENQDPYSREALLCYQKVDYWKQKFEQMLSENSVLQTFVDDHLMDGNGDFEKHEGTVNHMIDEYRQLKFHLISQQLENINTLKKMEAIKKQEEETLDRVKKLEEENEELKAHIEMDEELDTLQDQQDELMIKLLKEENMELKKELAQLTLALQMEEDEDSKTNEEIGNLRQRINNLTVENSDLQKVIAKLRYAQPPEDMASNKEEEEEADTWYDAMGLLDLHINAFVDHLLKIATDKEIAKNELSQVQENLQKIYQELSKRAVEGLDTGKIIFKYIRKELESRVADLIKSNITSSTLSTDSIRVIGKTLSNAVMKLYKMGANGISWDSNAEGVESKISNFHKKIENALINIESQWENFWSKMWSTVAPVPEDQVQPAAAAVDVDVEEPKMEVKSEIAPEPVLSNVEKENDFKVIDNVEAAPQPAPVQENMKIIQKAENNEEKVVVNEKIGSNRKHNKIVKNENVKKGNVKKENVKKAKDKKQKTKKAKPQNKLKSFGWEEPEENVNNTMTKDSWYEDRVVYRRNCRDVWEPDNWWFERSAYRYKMHLALKNEVGDWYFMRPKYRESAKKKQRKNKRKLQDDQELSSDDDDEYVKEGKKKCKGSKKEKDGKKAPRYFQKKNYDKFYHMNWEPDFSF